MKELNTHGFRVGVTLLSSQTSRLWVFRYSVRKRHPSGLACHCSLRGGATERSHVDVGSAFCLPQRSSPSLIWQRALEMPGVPSVAVGGGDTVFDMIHMDPLLCRLSGRAVGCWLPLGSIGSWKIPRLVVCSLLPLVSAPHKPGHITQ